MISILITTGEVVSAHDWEEQYDPNTEITIKGKISEIIIREHGPVILGVIKDNRIYNVLTAPYWYFEQERIQLNTGEEVVVYGAKFFSRRGEKFLMAREIHNISTGKIHTFRDESLHPCWRGRGKHRKFNPQ
ncbi:hypothetical protein [Thermodesulfovibrio hydrogeniphilus]